MSDPDPRRSASSKTARNMQKLSETPASPSWRERASSSLTMSSVTPWGASGARRIDVEGDGGRPQGTSDRSPTRDPSDAVGGTCRTASPAAGRRSAQRHGEAAVRLAPAPGLGAVGELEQLVGPQLVLAADLHLIPARVARATACRTGDSDARRRS